MPSRVRKLALAVHLTSSIGWIGAAVAYIPLVLVVLSNDYQRLVRDAILVMRSIDWFVILPLAYLALMTGLVMALGTPWGLFRHWWVVFSLLLTLAAVFVLTEYSLSLRDVAAVAAKPTLSYSDLAMLKDPGHAVHNIGGIGVLLAVAVLNIFKPQGVTRHGWRKQQDRRILAATRRAKHEPALSQE